MKARALYRSVKKTLEQQPDLSIFIWGPPGIGKSSIIRQIAEENKWGLKDLRMLLLDPTDIRGLPCIKGDQARWLPPAFLPNKDDEKEGIVFLDELPAAPPLVQASGYQLVLDRRVGEYKLPAGWRVVAAGNRLQDRAVTHRMPSPLQNRFIHLELEVDLEDWKYWAYRNHIDSKVISFLNFRPTLLFDFRPEKNQNSFATPRSWEFVSQLLRVGLGAEDFRELLFGAVGDGAGSEFLGYFKVFDKIPNVNKILEGENIVPDEPSVLYALTGVLVSKFGNEKKDYSARLLEYSMHLPAEFGVLLIKDCVKTINAQKIFDSKMFSKWTQKFKQVVL